MATFYVKDTQACWVTWTFPVEAESADEAYKKYTEGEHDAALDPVDIGDSIDGYDGVIEVSDSGQ